MTPTPLKWRVAPLIYCPASTGAQHTVQIEAGRVLIFVIIRWSNDAASLWWPPPYNPPPQDLIKHQRAVVWFKSPPHHSFRIFDAAATCAQFASCVEYLKLLNHKSCPWWYFAPNHHIIYGQPAIASWLGMRLWSICFYCWKSFTILKKFMEFYPAKVCVFRNYQLRRRP